MFSIIDSIEGVLEGFGAFFLEIEKKFGWHGQICKYEKRLGKSVNLSGKYTYLKFSHEISIHSETSLSKTPPLHHHSRRNNGQKR